MRGSGGEAVDQHLDAAAQRGDRRHIGQEAVEREQEHLGERLVAEHALDRTEDALATYRMDGRNAVDGGKRLRSWLDVVVVWTGSDGQ